MRGRATRPLIARTGDRGVLGPLSGAPLRSVSNADERYVDREGRDAQFPFEG